MKQRTTNTSTANQYGAMHSGLDAQSESCIDESSAMVGGAKIIDSDESEVIVVGQH